MLFDSVDKRSDSIWKQIWIWQTFKSQIEIWYSDGGVCHLFCGAPFDE